MVIEEDKADLGLVYLLLSLKMCFVLLKIELQHSTTLLGSHSFCMSMYCTFFIIPTWSDEIIHTPDKVGGHFGKKKLVQRSILYKSIFFPPP